MKKAKSDMGFRIWNEFRYLWHEFGFKKAFRFEFTRFRRWMRRDG